MFNRVICNSYGHAWVTNSFISLLHDIEIARRVSLLWRLLVHKAIGYARKTDTCNWIIWNHSVHSPFLFSCVSAGPPTMRTTVTTVAMDADVSGMFCTLGAVPHTMTLGISPAYISCSVSFPDPQFDTHAREQRVWWLGRAWVSPTVSWILRLLSVVHYIVCNTTVCPPSPLIRVCVYTCINDIALLE